MRRKEQPSSRRTGRADEAPARVPLYCFRCRHTFEGMLSPCAGDVKREGGNSAGVGRPGLPACPLCGRTGELYRIHRL